MNQFSSPAEGTSISIVHNEDMTHVVIVYGEFSGVGIAKCKETDRFSEEVGKGIALARALRDVGERMELNWIERSVSNRAWDKAHRKSVA